MRSGNKRPPKILVVDDSPEVGRFVKLFVRHWRADALVIYRSKGEAAWRECLRDKPDLLITDIYRDGMSGYEMLRLLARWKVRFPVLVISGGATEEDVRMCAGPELKLSFLAKPFTADQIAKELCRHLEGGEKGRLF